MTFCRHGCFEPVLKRLICKFPNQSASISSSVPFSDVFMDVGTIRLYNMAAADALLSQQRIIAIVQFRLEKKMLGALCSLPVSVSNFVV